MAKIEGRFATLNNSHTVKVCIYNKNLNKPNINIDTSNSVKFSDNPVEITQQQDNTFEHILRTQCKIRLVTKEWLGDYLFAANYSSIVVNVWVDNDCVFCGYVVPRTYNQNYAHVWEEIDINCVDILSTLKDRRLTDDTSYEELVAQSTTRPFSWFFGNMDLDTTTVVIPNYPDIDYGEAEMMWTEIDWTRVVSQEGDITYYGIEAEVVLLDEDTAMNTGNTRQGQQKIPTWIESTDTCIVDGVSYYKEYAHITVNGEDVNTGDWRVGSNAGGMPVVVDTENRIDGWTVGVLPQPFDFYEHYTTYNIYDNGMEIAGSDGIGDNIPEYPSTTSHGSYYEFRQGSDTDLDIDENTGIRFYKDYAWVCVNNECTNSGQWQRGQMYNQFADCQIYGTMVSGSQYPPTMMLNNNVVTADEYDSDTQEFGFSNVPTLTYFNIDSEKENIETMYFGDVFANNTINMYQKFKNCYNLKLLDIHNIKLVDNWASAFEDCRSLTMLNTNEMSPFNSISSNSYRMFYGCSNLSGTLDCRRVSSNSASLMFCGCTRVNKVMLSNNCVFENDSVNMTLSMFENSGITEVEYYNENSVLAWPNFTTFKLITELWTNQDEKYPVFTLVNDWEYDNYSIQYSKNLVQYVSNYDFVSTTDITITCMVNVDNQLTTITLNADHSDRFYYYKIPNEYINDVVSISASGYMVAVHTPRFVINNQGSPSSWTFNVDEIDLTYCSPETTSDGTIHNGNDIYEWNSSTQQWEIQNNN